MKDLSGRTAIVTGAGRGIGRAVALALSAQGASVALLARTESQIAQVCRELAGHSRTGSATPPASRAARSPIGPTATAEPDGVTGRAVALQCDVTDPASVRAAVAAAEKALGPADILVNAAGDAVAAPLAKTDDALWNHLLLVNLTGTFLLIREVAPGMIARGGGRIINIASVAGLAGAAYVSAYTAAKHGVVGLTRALAVELAKHGITVNAVCPGYVDTPLTDRSVASIAARSGMSGAEARAKLSARSPQNRLITPEEVAASVAYLASEEARSINGQAIVLDGGGQVA